MSHNCQLKGEIPEGGIGLLLALRTQIYKKVCSHKRDVVNIPLECIKDSQICLLSLLKDRMGVADQRGSEVVG